jgi:uncharacterized protein involved in exopolysaccharide biosynthesis
MQPATQIAGLQAAPPPVYAPPQEPPNFIDVLRKLWRRRGLIFLVTMAFAIITFVIVKTLPSYYVAESRVLIGIPPLRALNIESIIADIAPDADLVQNESYIITSREVAQATIGKLHLDKNPEFNPFLRKPSFVAVALSSRIPGCRR